MKDGKDGTLGCFRIYRPTFSSPRLRELSSQDVAAGVSRISQVKTRSSRFLATMSCDGYGLLFYVTRLVTSVRYDDEPCLYIAHIK